MKKNLLVVLFILPLFLSHPIFAQDQDAVKAIMTNAWVKKYKKLKSDLEDKALRVKDMGGISERDRLSIEKSYSQTSQRLEQWLDALILEVGTNNQVALAQITEGGMEPVLKQELLDIFSFYANDFSAHYEQVTGEGVNAIMLNSRLMEDGEQNLTIKVPTAKIEKEVLIAYVKKPLSPTAWSALY